MSNMQVSGHLRSAGSGAWIGMGAFVSTSVVDYRTWQWRMERRCGSVSRLTVEETRVDVAHLLHAAIVQAKEKFKRLEDDRMQAESEDHSRRPEPQKRK